MADAADSIAVPASAELQGHIPCSAPRAWNSFNGSAGTASSRASSPNTAAADVVADSAADERVSRIDAQEFARDIEGLGPTFIKLGQLLSTRADLLPPAYLDALARLQDDVEPFPFADVERIVEEELGVRLSKAFADFDETPLAAASLGQVHRAVLRDGREVAVKVQRPDVREQVLQDLDALDEVAALLERFSTVDAQRRRAGGARGVPPHAAARARLPRRRRATW